MIEGEMAELKVEKWLADSKGIQQIVVGNVKKLTEKAVLLELDGEEIWMPLSQVTEKRR